MTTHIEEIASKVMGKAKMAKGAIEGLSGIFTMLMEEHGQVAALLMRVKSSSDPALRRELWPKIRAELLSHEKGELLVLYPVYRAHSALAYIAEEHEREAGQLASMIEEIHALDVADPRWGERFAALVQVVQRHVMEEERNYFREGNRVFGSQSKALGEQFKQAKEKLRSQLV